jgi:hypothetical protein
MLLNHQQAHRLDYSRARATADTDGNLTGSLGNQSSHADLAQFGANDKLELRVEECLRQGDLGDRNLTIHGERRLEHRPAVAP